MVKYVYINLTWSKYLVSILSAISSDMRISSIILSMAQIFLSNVFWDKFSPFVLKEVM